MAPKDNAALLQRLRATFEGEANERLRALAALLAELAQQGPSEREAELVETLFREVHSLKGAARAVNLSNVEMLCATLESALASLKRHECALSPAFIDMLSCRVDELGALLALDASPGASAVPATQTGREVARSAPSPRQPSMASNAATVRISTAKLEALHTQAEELLAFKYSIGDLSSKLNALSAAVAGFGKDWNKPAGEARRIQRAREQAERGRVSIGSVDLNGGSERVALRRLVDAVLNGERFATSLCEQLAELRTQIAREQRALTGATNQLQDDVRQALMLPFTSMFDMLPKLVHDLARDSGKNVALRINDTAIEVDRRILEHLKDPLIHLIRNAVDHGIELPVERIRRNKPAQGLISVSLASTQGNKVELIVADDGAGIDLAKVRGSAARLGLTVPQDTSGTAQSLKLIFESGLSTSPALTDLSGRGLGLAIVQEKVERLGGSVEVTQPAEGGTSFRLVLPTTLSTFRGLVVAAAGRRFVIPLQNVVRVGRVATDTVRTVENRPTVEIDGQVLALAHLSEVLNLTVPDAAKREGKSLFLAVLVNGAQRIAFVVDEVIGDQDVQVKGLGPQLEHVPNVAGATVLEAGRVVPVLNVPDLFNSSLRAARRVPAHSAVAGAEKTRPSLLVVEDSITSRSLLKHILESAGYDVMTAVDGVDGLTAARSGKFDLVVSDVEMPRMDGFELTARLRQDKRLSAIPVVLVTALESLEDKQRGIEVGANAYIVKSSFEQSNLLETIRGIL